MNNTQSIFGISNGQFPRSFIYIGTNPGFGSTGTTTAYFSAVLKSQGSDFNYVPSSVNGDYIQVKTSGVYTISALLAMNTNSSSTYGITLNNDANTSVAAGTTPSATLIGIASIENTSAVGAASPLVVTIPLTAGDRIRVQYNNVSGSYVTNPAYLQMCKIA